MTSTERNIKNATSNSTLHGSTGAAELDRRQQNFQTDTEEDSQAYEEPQEEGERDDDGEEAIGSTKPSDYDEPDEFTKEDYGKPRKRKGKRGRPKTKPTEEARVALALDARRKRIRLNYGTPDSNEKNPKRHLFGPTAEMRGPSDTASPTPSRPAIARSDMKKVNAATSPHSPVFERIIRRKSVMHAKNPPSKQSIPRPPSPYDSAKPPRRSLIVKLKTQSALATTDKASTTPPEEHTHRTQNATKTRARIKDEDACDEKASSQAPRAMPAPEPQRETRRTTRVTRRQRSAVATSRTETGSGEPPARPSAPASTSTSTSDDNNNNNNNNKNTSDTIPEIPAPPPPPPPTFAPYPPMSPRSLPPFTRGALIALENILADHQSDLVSSLIDLVEELDDTRPIVNDWEHVTVMKGGSWVYQVMRDVWEEAIDDDDEEEEGEGEDMDIEDVVERVGGWVDREVGRLGGGGGGGGRG